MKFVSTEVLRVTPLRSQPSTRACDNKIVSSIVSSSELLLALYSSIVSSSKL